MSDTTGRFADDAHRYELESRIATGGMGEVWRGSDTTLGRRVAVKVLKAEHADDPAFRRRFETEARHAASLHHPGIAGVFDFGEAAPTDGSAAPRPYLVMELVEGQPLSDLLRPSAPMDPEVVRDLMAQAATALGAAHRAGIVHRDVKPGNLIITPDRQVKVTDFGIARAAEGMALTETGQVLGTPAYISPEQAQGDRATQASDVYSLAVVAFECLAGHRPFSADTPVATAVAHLRQPVPDLPATVPADLASVVRRALAKDPEERYADGTAFAAALRDPSSAEAGAAGAVGAGAGSAAAGAGLVSGEPATDTATENVAHTPPDTQVLPATPASGEPATPPPSRNVGHSPPGSGPDARRGGVPAWLPWVLLAAVLIVAALIVWRVAAGEDEEPTDQRPSPTRTTNQPPESESPTPTEVEVDADDYIGMDVDDAAAALSELGLRVRRTEVDNPGDETEGTVSGVDPSGTLSQGDSVTVTFWGPQPEETPTEQPTEEPTQTPSGTPSGTPTETATQTPTQSPTAPTESPTP